MRPVRDRILAKPIKDKDNTNSGIFVGATQVKQNLFQVVSIGPSVKNIYPGQIVKAKSNAGVTFVYEGENYQLLAEGKKDRPGDIIAIVGKIGMDPY